MDKYDKWKVLLADGEKRDEWLDFYQQNYPVFAEVMDFVKSNPDCYETPDLIEIAKLELSIIAILDEQVKKRAKSDSDSTAESVSTVQQSGMDHGLILKYLLDLAFKKYKPWFATLCMPWDMTEEQRRRAYVESGERNLKWSHAVAVIRDLLESENRTMNDENV